MLWTLPASAAEWVIEQKDKSFLPEEINAKVGDTITFRNSETRKIRHNVYAITPGFEDFKIKVQLPGESHSLPLAKDGTIAIRCAFHPRMKTTINVSK